MKRRKRKVADIEEDLGPSIQKAIVSSAYCVDKIGPNYLSGTGPFISNYIGEFIKESGHSSYTSDTLWEKWSENKKIVLSRMGYGRNEEFIEHIGMVLDPVIWSAFDKK